MDTVYKYHLPFVDGPRAEHIVHCVNSHEELIGALVDMVVLARLGIIACEKSGCNDKQAINMWNQYEQARAILAKAKSLPEGK